MDAEAAILAIRQRTFDGLCERIHQHLQADNLAGEAAKELKSQLNATANELLNLIDERIRATLEVDVIELLVDASETVRTQQQNLALELSQVHEPTAERAEDPQLFHSTMREVMANTGYMREPRVPTFNGKPEMWPTFRDLFLSEVEQRYPDDITKLIYLQQYCTDEAKQALGQWPPTSANYKLAWNTLCARFNDERAIKQSAANIITTLPRIHKETREGLRLLIDTTNNALRQLEAAGCPVGSWDELVISKWMTCLPAVTYRKWKRHLRGRANITYNELCEFVEVEARTCDEIERRGKEMQTNDDQSATSSQQGNDAPAPRTNRDNYRSRSWRRNRPERKFGQSEVKYEVVTPKSETTVLGTEQMNESSSTTSENRCVICQMQHPFWKCEPFREMSAAQRKSEVEKRRLCFQCLGQHLSRDCKSTYNCKRCQRPHSTLLCTENRPAQTSNNPK